MTSHPGRLPFGIPKFQRLIGRRARPLRTCLLTAGLVVLATTVSPTRAADPSTGLTGASKTEDVVQARQLLMDGLEEQMMAIEAATATPASNLPLEALKNRAYLMNILISAFPHLFPPQTMPAPEGQDPGYQTNALPQLWQEFDKFYDAAQSAASTALTASQASNAASFRESIATLRKSCDSCHSTFANM